MAEKKTYLHPSRPAFETYYQPSREAYEANPDAYERRLGVCPWCGIEYEVVAKRDINWPIVMRACYMCKG
jgi:hypothetical protein